MNATLSALVNSLCSPSTRGVRLADGIGETGYAASAYRLRTVVPRFFSMGDAVATQRLLQACGTMPSSSGTAECVCFAVSIPSSRLRKGAFASLPNQKNGTGAGWGEPAMAGSRVRLQVVYSGNNPELHVGRRPCERPRATRCPPPAGGWGPHSGGRAKPVLASTTLSVCPITELR